MENLKRDAWKLREKIDLVTDPVKKAELLREYAMLINALEASPDYVLDLTYSYSELTVIRVHGVRYHLLCLVYCVLKRLRLL